jgi:hypothetical protein
MNGQEIIERVMTMHWDIFACRCWVCEAGREAGYRPREEFLDWRDKQEYVDVKLPLSTKVGSAK